MSTTDPIQMQPPDDADGDSAEYRSISVAAIVALVLGLASPLNFVSPALIVVPLAAVGFALLAARSISASGNALAGRGLAMAGLAVAAFCAAAAPTHTYTRDSRYLSQATKTGETWLTHIAAGDSKSAGELTSVAAIQRLTPEQPTGLPAIGTSGPLVTNYARLLDSEPVVEALRAASRDGDLSMVRVGAELAFLQGRVQCVMRFDAAGADDQSPLGVNVSALLPTLIPNAEWVIDEWSLVE